MNFSVTSGNPSDEELLALRAILATHKPVELRPVIKRSVFVDRLEHGRHHRQAWGAGLASVGLHQSLARPAQDAPDLLGAQAVLEQLRVINAAVNLPRMNRNGRDGRRLSIAGA